jgi:hypothetical protein
MGPGGKVNQTNRRETGSHDILIAYVGNVSEPANARIYVLTNQEAVDIGVYVVTHPSHQLVERLRSHEASRARWKEKILRVGGTGL